MRSLSQCCQWPEGTRFQFARGLSEYITCGEAHLNVLKSLVNAVVRGTSLVSPRHNLAQYIFLGIIFNYLLYVNLCFKRTRCGCHTWNYYSSIPRPPATARSDALEG